MKNRAPTNKFPLKLQRFLEMASNDPKMSGVISWLPCGKAFKIHDRVAFSEWMLPVYFGGMHSLSSFRRQLSIYSIKKVLKGHQSLRDLLAEEKNSQETQALHSSHHTNNQGKERINGPSSLYYALTPSSIPIT
jgi:hypothetical protein